MDMKVGQGFVYSDKKSVVHGLIVGVNETSVKWIPVVQGLIHGHRVRAYDDVDAVYSVDRNHVRLNSCPPPFSFFGCYSNFKGQSVSNSIAVADMTAVHILGRNTFDEYCQIIDDGVQVSDKDMETVFNHPWQSRRQKEKLISDMSELNLDDVHQDFSFQ
jgi:hypothetical protein